jgi:hypothetical protein
MSSHRFGESPVKQEGKPAHGLDPQYCEACKGRITPELITKDKKCMCMEPGTYGGYSEWR